MLSYELAKKIKDAGFPQVGGLNKSWFTPKGNIISQISSQSASDLVLNDFSVIPTIEDLLEALGEDITVRLQSYYWQNELEWQADTCGNFQEWDASTHKAEVGETPETSLALLWLSLHR